MSSKNPLIISNDTNIGQVTDLPLKHNGVIERNLSQTFLPQTFSASESESDDDVSESDSDQNLDPIADSDPNDTLEVSKPNPAKSIENDGKFRGRPSSCVFVARYVTRSDLPPSSELY
jgi:hypothetical protein